MAKARFPECASVSWEDHGGGPAPHPDVASSSFLLKPHLCRAPGRRATLSCWGTRAAGRLSVCLSGSEAVSTMIRKQDSRAYRHPDMLGSSTPRRNSRAFIQEPCWWGLGGVSAAPGQGHTERRPVPGPDLWLA